MSGSSNGTGIGDNKPAHPSIEFLRKFAPDIAWPLVAVPLGPDFTSPVVARTFSEGESAAAWIDERRATNKIYFMLNPAASAIDRPPKREDVDQVRWLHLDLYLGEGQSDSDALTADRLLRRNLPPEFAGPPTVAIQSGDTIHALWRLTSPLIAEDRWAADMYNLGLAVEFGFSAENYAETGLVFGCNRLIALPGAETPPLPPSPTPGAGRKGLLRVLWHGDEAYPISAFRKATKTQSREDEGLSPEVTSSGPPGDLVRVESVSHLQAVAKSAGGSPIDEYILDLVVHGYDPKDKGNAARHLPKLYARESDALFAVACALVRSGVPDDVVVSVVTDPKFAISRSVRARSKALDYAVRQVARAHQHVESPELLELNDRHAIISDMGGRCVVITEVEDRGRRVISKQSFQNFKDRYVKRKIKTGSKTVGKAPNEVVLPTFENLADWWLKHPLGNQYDRIVFSPGVDVPGCYNLWQGFAVEPRAGDCSLYLAHIMDNVCSGNKEHYAYLLNWMARAIQRPNEIGFTAIVLRGRQRTGKTFFGQWFGKLFGKHMWHIADADLLVGRFNAHLRDSVLIVADEAFYAGDKKHESKLKMLITQEEVPYEPKGVDTEMGPNFTHLIMSSDKDWVVPVGLDEQRFFILNISDSKMNHHTYFRAIEKQMLAGGLEALLHHLLTRDITEFEVRAIPQTDALVRQKMLSMNTEQQWWYLKLHAGAILPRHDGWVSDVLVAELQADYYSFAEMTRQMRPSNPITLGMFLANICPGIYPETRQKRVQVDGQATQGAPRFRLLRHYGFPPLEDCRIHFNRHLGANYEWPEIDESEDDRDGPGGQARIPMQQSQQHDDPAEVPF